MDEEVRRLIARLGADAVRNSDGTELPGIVSELATKVYSTYFVGRGDNAWADAHPDEATRIFLMSDRVSATADGPVSIDLLASWFADQVRPDTGCDVTRWWQAHDRTTGRDARKHAIFEHMYSIASGARAPHAEAGSRITGTATISRISDAFIDGALSSRSRRDGPPRPLEPCWALPT